MTQSTIATQIDLHGIGVHSGTVATMSVHPAQAETGILFVRSDLDEEHEIQAIHRAVAATELCTVLGDPAGASIATVEHLIAALRGMGIDNALVEIDGPEVPIMDGSAAPFVDAIQQAGIRVQDAPRRFIKVLKPVRFEANGSLGEFLPHDSFAIDISIVFDCDLIGEQRIILDVTPDVFARELARARTFGFMRDVERLWAAGYAMGASLENTVVLGDEQVMNPEGLRWSDEFVRHKALDAVGDLALAGAPILGCYRSVRGGHRLNYQALKALLDDRSAWTMVEAGERRDSGHAELLGTLAAAAYGPSVS